MCYFVVLQAAFAHSALTVPLYDTLGPETVEFVVNQTDLTTVVCAGAVELQKLVAIAGGGRCPSLQVSCPFFCLFYFIYLFFFCFLCFPSLEVRCSFSFVFVFFVFFPFLCFDVY